MTPISLLKGKQISAHLRVLETNVPPSVRRLANPVICSFGQKKQRTIHLSTAKLSAHTRHLNDFTCSNNGIKPYTASEI